MWDDFMLSKIMSKINEAWSRPDFAGVYSNYSEGLFQLAAEFLSPGDIAIDAGGYLGNNSFAFAAVVGKGGKVLTFEPDPRLFKKLSERISQSGESGYPIKLSSNALGSSPGTAEFLVVNEIEGHSGLFEKPEAYYGGPVTKQKISVAIETLDDVVKQLGLDYGKVKAIKYDMEGGELGALRGSVISIATGQPTIMFEYGDPTIFGISSEYYYQFFNSIGYQLVTCFDTDIATLEQLNNNVGWNLFAIPRRNPFARGDLSRLIAPKLEELVSQL